MQTPFDKLNARRDCRRINPSGQTLGLPTTVVISSWPSNMRLATALQLIQRDRLDLGVAAVDVVLPRSSCSTQSSWLAILALVSKRSANEPVR